MQTYMHTHIGLHTCIPTYAQTHANRNWNLNMYNINTLWNHTINVNIPIYIAIFVVFYHEEFNKYTKMQLDMALTCPGTRDVTCAEWDRTVVLRVCCKTGSQLCDMELGRWISPYRR